MEPDNIPDEVRERIRKFLQEKHPDYELRFIDGPDDKNLPPKLVADLDQTLAFFRDTLEQGVCRDCGKKIPMTPWPPKPGTLMVDGWSLYADMQGRPVFILCDACEELAPKMPDV